MKQWLESFIELLYPQLCITCRRKLFADEDYMCLKCWNDLPRTNFHNDRDNKIAQLFWGRVPVENATSWLFFRKGSQYQQLIHHLKYREMKEIGYELGKIMGKELAGSAFATADVVFPLPLHKKKEKQRGYNQSAWIAKGISESLQKPVSFNNLIRAKYTDTQTRKTRFERWENVEGIFEVTAPQEIKSKHILLVDDVVTTGSTLEAAVRALNNAGADKTSVVTLAYSE